MKKVVRVVVALILVAVIGAGIYLYADYRKYAPMREDYERISSEDYTSVFFSTFPTDHFKEDDFFLFREEYVLKTSYCIPDRETLDGYFEKMSETWNEVGTVYLGIRPDIITAGDLLSLTEQWIDKNFTVILAYPSMRYWQGLKEEKYMETLSAYTDFFNTLMPVYAEDTDLRNRLSVRFYNTEEWLICNPANYENDFKVNEGISYLITMHSTNNEAYKITPENYETALEEFEDLVEEYRTEPKEYPDLSNWNIVFFGDSVIAVENSSSIPGTLSGLTGAHTYNFGVGGTNAVSLRRSDLGLPVVAKAFLTKDLSLLKEDSQAYAEMSDYFEHPPKGKKTCFVISFGLNDYYCGYPVRSEDPHDKHTYSGALRNTIEELQDQYPDAVFLLMTPNFTSLFGNGLEPQSEEGGLLVDYVAAVISLSEEKNTLLFDSYNELNINSGNHADYLFDGTHPNYSTRYYMAQCLAEVLRTQLTEKD